MFLLCKWINMMAFTFKLSTLDKNIKNIQIAKLLSTEIILFLFFIIHIIYLFFDFFCCLLFCDCCVFPEYLWYKLTTRCDEAKPPKYEK